MTLERGFLWTSFQCKSMKISIKEVSLGKRDYFSKTIERGEEK